MRQIKTFIAALLLTWAPLNPGWAADSTVSALPAASALAGTELLYGVQSGGDVKITATQVQTFIGALTSTNLTAGCATAVSGGAITNGVGLIAANESYNPQTGTNYPFKNADCGNYNALSNGSNQVPTIPQAGAGGNFTAGWFNDTMNNGAGTQTLTPTTSTINGNATQLFRQGEGGRIVSDGSNYFLASFSVNPAFSHTWGGTQTVNNLTVSGTCTGCGGGITIGTTTITSGTSTRILYDNAGVAGEYTLTGSGTVVAMQTSPSLITPTLGVAAATSVSSTASNVNTQSIAAVSTDGYVLTNTTAAAAGAQQWSPRLRLTGQGWKTTATAASETTDFIIENQPVQGAATPTSNLVISSQINAAGYVAAMTLSNTGQILLPAGANQAAGISFGGTGNNGIYAPGASNFYFAPGAGGASAEARTSGIGLGSSSILSWGSLGAAQDTGLSRVSAGVVGVGTGANASVAGTISVATIINGGITSDATHTDATICEDTTTHQFYSGSGTLGICLGTSGHQFKTDIVPMKAGITELMQIDLKNYHYLPGYGDNGARLQYGPVAQDVAAVFPDLVGRNGDGEIINYDIGAILMVALHAIQQQQAEIDTLKSGAR